MEEICNIPEWFGIAILNAIGWIFITIWTLLSGLIGFIFKTIWDAWKHHCLPFKKDKEQFESLVTKENAQVVRFFRENNNPFIEYCELDALEQFQEKLDDPSWSQHQNRQLKSKKNELVNAVEKMIEFLCRSTQPASNGGGVLLPVDEDRKKKYFILRDSLVQGFESYRDYGTRIFSVKISKEPQNC